MSVLLLNWENGGTEEPGLITQGVGEDWNKKDPRLQRGRKIPLSPKEQLRRLGLSKAHLDANTMWERREDDSSCL